MDKVSYALGMSVAQQMVKSGVKTLNTEDFTNGVRTVVENLKPEISVEEGNKLLEEYFDQVQKENQERIKKANAASKKYSADYLAENAKAEGVVTTKSGLQYRVITEGTGRQPEAHNQVKCHYEGRLLTGDVFDSSYQRGEPATFGLHQVIAGWTEGLQLMKEGAKYEFFIPSELAYGENGIPGHIPGNAALIFTVELLKVL